MEPVRAKKCLGQHFLKDENIARKIVQSYSCETTDTLEVGPGMGVLTKYLLELPGLNCYFIEKDRESVDFLSSRFPQIKERFLYGDVLTYDTHALFPGNYGIIGNFPYFISSQIFFRVLEDRQRVTEVVGMIQKEVAERIAAKEGSKTYGILSVLLQAFYDIEYLFTVSEHVFSPPPKVKSAVIRLKRNSTIQLDCDEDLFFRVVKAAFNQRRKTLRNSIRQFLPEVVSDELEGFLGKRAEQLSVGEFVKLTSSLAVTSV